MKIESGKYYRTRSGECVQVRWWGGGTDRPDVDWPVEYTDRKGDSQLLTIDGRAALGLETPYDIVSEWDGPGPCKAGDRVRCVAESTSVNDDRFGRVGDLATVKVAFDGTGFMRLCFDGASEIVRCTPSRFVKIETPVAVPEPRRFKEGDRVRVATDRWGKDQQGKVGTVIEDDGDPDGSCPLNVEFDDEQPDGRDGGETRCYEHADLEPWDGSAAGALKIEAGKLYLLKNGLCVGPIEAEAFDGTFVWKAPQDIHDLASAGWTDSGKFDPENDYNLDGALDIDAEWIGKEPVFKPGDRVVSVCDDVEDIDPGDEFEVLAVLGDGPRAEIRFIDNAEDERERPACRYRLAGAEPQQGVAEPERGFKPADRIVSIDDDDLDISPGDVFTVTACDRLSVHFDDRAGTARRRPADRYRLAEPDPEFAAGELIKSISDESDDIRPGDTFTATAIENRGGTWLVTFIHPVSGERTRFAARYARARACEMEAAE